MFWVYIVAVDYRDIANEQHFQPFSFVHAKEKVRLTLFVRYMSVINSSDYEKPNKRLEVMRSVSNTILLPKKRITFFANFL